MEKLTGTLLPLCVCSSERLGGGEGLHGEGG